MYRSIQHECGRALPAQGRKWCTRASDVSVDEHSRLGQIMFANWRCEGPVLAPSRLIDLFDILFSFAGLRGERQCAIWGVRDLVDNWWVQLGRLSLLMLDVEAAAGCWCWCWIFPTWLGVPFDNGLKCYCYRCCRLVLMLTSERWWAVVDGAFWKLFSMCLGRRCFGLVLFNLASSELLRSVLVFVVSDAVLLWMNSIGSVVWANVEALWLWFFS